MPSTMQQSIVKNSAISTEPWERVMMAVMIWEARPVTVMQPPMMPATPQAAATEMELLAPFASASKNTPGVMTASFLNIQVTAQTIATSSSGSFTQPGSSMNR